MDSMRGMDGESAFYSPLFSLMPRRLKVRASQMQIRQQKLNSIQISLYPSRKLATCAPVLQDILDIKMAARTYDSEHESKDGKYI